MKAGDDRDVALEAKDSALRVWQVRYLDMSRQHDAATAEVVRLTAKLKVEEKARRYFEANIKAGLNEHGGECDCGTDEPGTCVFCRIWNALTGRVEEVKDAD